MTLFDIKAGVSTTLLASTFLLASCGGSDGGPKSAGVQISAEERAQERAEAENPTEPETPEEEETIFPVVEAMTEGLLRDTFRNNFKVGTTITANQIDNDDLSIAIAKNQFNVVTPEYELKASDLAPTEGVYTFDRADIIVDWAIENDIEVRGHALLWHESTPDYFLEGTEAEIKTRLEDYITTVMTHFKGRVKVWDVVNEAISTDIYAGDDGVGPYRDSVWYNAVGEQYIDWAFNAARAADPDAQLFLSDYGTEDPIKRAWMVEIAQDLLDRGIPVDGIGHQFHLQSTTEADQAIEAIAQVDGLYAGLLNHVTELDINVYSDPGSCWESETDCQADYGPTPPAQVLNTQAQLVKDIFDGLTTHPSVETIAFWGVRDGDSWLNYVPVERSNHPLLFARDGAPKPMYNILTDPNHVPVEDSQ